MNAIEVGGLSVSAGRQSLLEDTGFSIPAGKLTVLVGRSGTGKSILLRILAGLLPRQSEQGSADDQINWQGNISPDFRAGVVFQQFALFDELSPIENVQFAIDHRIDTSQPPRHSATEWLELLGVPPQTAVASLSGGQKQRLAIARTLAAEPEVLLYDEPTSGLDTATAREVANLISETQSKFGRTSLVVTHDIETLLPIADQVLLLDSSQQRITALSDEQSKSIPEMLRLEVEKRVEDGKTTHADDTRAATRNDQATLPKWQRLFWRPSDRFLQATGRTVIKTLSLPLELISPIPSPRWAFRFWRHDLHLIGGLSACVYLLIAGLIAGFTTTYFTLKFLPFRLYTQPLLIDDILASIGFALYRILVPVLATILIAARCGAAIAADVGVKQYGGQIDALRTLGVQRASYLLLPIMLAFLIATPLLEWLAFQAAQGVSRLTFTMNYPEIGVYFWQQHFYREIQADTGEWFRDGCGWVLLKNALCGIGTAAISYHQGVLPKQSASDVSAGITVTVLWSTLYVLSVHFVIALLEF